MVVDDEEFCITTMKQILKVSGIDIENVLDLCYDGNDAVETVKLSYGAGITYSFIFTDFSMPVKDGIQASREIREFL